MKWIAFVAAWFVATATEYEQLTGTCQDAESLGGGSTVLNVEACQNLCNDYLGCKAVDTDGSTCYLKGHCEGTLGSCNGWCAYRQVQDKCSATSELDCKDQDLANGHKKVTTKDECCDACASFSGCVTWTFYETRGDCYLKSGCDNPTQINAVSGGRVAPSPTPSPPPPPSPAPSPSPAALTVVSIDGSKWMINGEVVNKGTAAEGAMLNARMINGIFDDDNQATRNNWKYPDTGVWDPNRNTGEFVGNMSMWKEAGMTAFTIGLQGGSPHCYGNNGWKVNAFNSDGSLKEAWMQRLRKVLDEADRLGMVAIVQYFYYAQFNDIQANADAAVTAATHWLIDTGLHNFIVEAYNENCQDFVSEFVDRIHSVSQARGRKLLVASSCGGGGKSPTDDFISKSDYVMLHGNGQTPSGVSNSINGVKSHSSYKSSPKPIVYNEDDHGDFTEGDSSNLMSAVKGGASWGHLCCCDGSSQGDYATGYQCPPIAWNDHGSCLEGSAGHPQPKGSKKAWYEAVRRLTKTQIVALV